MISIPRSSHFVAASALGLGLFAGTIAAQDRPRDPSGDWLGFRGSDATATSTEIVPREWSAKKGLLWQTELLGPGASSPVLIGDGVFLTCWSGYGLKVDAPGDIGKLQRHLLKMNRKTGKVVWRRDVAPVPTEDPFGGRMATHGYASSTPVSDGKHVYVMFGKSGVFAFDLEGKQIWHTSVGTGSSEWTTGSGSSPALWKDMLFVNASDESHALVALDKKTGKEIWRRGARTLDQAYATPIVAGTGDQAVLLFPILGEVWGLDPLSGHTRWFARTKSQGALAPSPIVDGNQIYSFGGRTRLRGYKIRLGGTGDVTDSHIEWQSRYGAYVATPVLLDDRLYFGDDGGILHCVDAKTGALIYKHRLEGSFYSSPIVAGGLLYLVSRQDGAFVVQPGAEFKLIAHNRIESDTSKFHGTPAVGKGVLFLRSNRSLYCVGK